jgi:amino acid adenylation domain-containing protein
VAGQGGAGIPRRNPEEPVRPGFSQEQLWFFERLHPGTATYNVPDFWRVRGPLDVGALARALTELTRRQEALRTVFGEVAGRPVLVIRPAEPLRLAVAEAPGGTPEERHAWAEGEAEAEARRPFDLAAGPLFRARLLRVAADEHWLLLHAHHSITDGWSLSLQQRELSALYQSFRAGQEPALPPLPVTTFADYAAWQRARWAAGELAEQAAWWRGQLAGLPALVTLPGDRPRPAVADHRGGQESRCLPPAARAGLQALGREAGATPFMVAAALTQVLLQRHTGETDIVIGTPAAGREQAELHGLIGFFVNMLVLRQRVEPATPFRELLRQTRETARAAYAHQELPFEKLVAELAPARDAGSNPLFQVAVVYERADDHGLTLAGTTAERLWPATRTSKFDLLLTFREEAASLRVCVDYRLDLYEPATIRRLLDHLEVLTAGALAHPDQAVGTLPLLPEAERRQLEQWHGPARDYPPGRCLHELVWAQVERTPGAVAVMCGDTRLSYRELGERAGRVAAALRARGVGPGALVGVFVERSADLVAAVLGVLQSGAAYVPMDPLFPRERLGWMIEDAALPVIVTQSSLVAALPPHQAKLLCLDQPLPETLNSQLPTPNSQPDDPAYVIFTSGSTGRPKGVVVEHRNVVNVLRSICREPGFSESDTMLAVTTLSFDIAVAELFLPLTTGGRLVIAEREIAADGHRLRSLLETCRATFLQPTPVTWRLLLEAGWPGSPDLKMICTGEPLPPDLAAQLLPKGKSLWNLYGPTETTIWSTGCRITDAAEITIGRPIANTQVYIVNEALQLQPVGVPGELLIGGDGVARGYLNRPELTAEKFIANPFGEGRVYRTGDLARWRSDGTLECLGRLDHQVKVRGFRIELGEIETALALAEGVRQAVVVLREEQLVAYVVPVAADPSEPLLREHLRRKLPEYMVPARYVVVAELPLTPNGKVDRKALPAPDWGGGSGAGTYAAPRTPVEATLARIWSEVLRVERVGIHDHFFDLGGHSLLAVQAQARIRERLRVGVELRDFFQGGTVAHLAERIEQAAPATAADMLPEPAADRETGEL